jgi:hypothetical protein
MPRTIAMRVDESISSMLAGRRSSTTSIAGRPSRNESPKSNRAASAR